MNHIEKNWVTFDFSIRQDRSHVDLTPFFDHCRSIRVSVEQIDFYFFTSVPTTHLVFIGEDQRKSFSMNAEISLTFFNCMSLVRKAFASTSMLAAIWIASMDLRKPY
jgi:hypothetical protein